MYEHQRFAIKTSLWSLLLFKKLFFVDREKLLRKIDARNIWFYGEAETATFKPPIDLFDMNIPSPGGILFDQPFVCRIEDTALLGPSGLAMCGSGMILTEPSVNYFNATSAVLDTSTRQIFRKNTPVLDCAFSTVTPYSGRFYYHWLVETLPCIQGIRHYAAVTGEKPLVIIKKNPPNWVLESLALAGFERKDLFEYDGTALAIKNLVVPSYRRQGMFSPLSSINWIKNEMHAGPGCRRKSASPRIYISRNDAGSRRIINEKELLSYIEPLGFRKVLLSGMQVRDQVELFNNARCVIAPHGAGLTNIVFSERTSSIVELFGEFINPCFYMLADMLNLLYACVPCRQIGVDMLVDIKKIQKVLELNEIRSTL